MSAPKRKLDQENSIFQVRWETDYLFTEFKGKPICLVCLETKSAKKDFNSSRHYNTTHKEKFEKYTGVARAAVVADLKGKIHGQQSLFTKTTTAQKSALKAYVRWLNLSEMTTWLETLKLTLSRRTVTRRIFDIQNHVEEKLKQVINDCKYFSLALDESTDVTDVSQLLIFNRTIDSSSEVHEELLKLVSLHETTKGTDIFKAVKTVVNEHGGFGKLSAIIYRCTLERFFALRNELPVFLEECLRCDTSAYCCKLQDTAFLCDMAFLTDITSHLNHLNIQLQGRCQTVPDLYAHMNAFRRKLELFRDGFSSVSPNLAHFPSCEEMCTDVPACEKIFPKYRADTETLLQQFSDCFQDFHAMQPRVALFTASFLPNEKEISFWRLLPESRFPLLRDFSLSMASMFGSTYICESSFSTMKHINSKERNRLTDETIPAHGRERERERESERERERRR
uniref:HAT C-terminal dimerisation domain-containing protein n=1 Tax=Amphiprion ocellaris TaxID=80972 RepID=A0A3Q1CL92_AMPOC